MNSPISPANFASVDYGVECPANAGAERRGLGSSTGISRIFELVRGIPELELGRHGKCTDVFNVSMASRSAAATTQQNVTSFEQKISNLLADLSECGLEDLYSAEEQDLFTKVFVEKFNLLIDSLQSKLTEGDQIAKLQICITAARLKDALIWVDTVMEHTNCGTLDDVFFLKRLISDL